MFGGASSAWPKKSDAELQVFVENLFLGVDVSELIASTSMPEPADFPAMKAALVYVGEVGLVEWTRRIKFQCGVAPRTRVCSSTWRGSAWRGRWGGKSGRLRIKEDISFARPALAKTRTPRNQEGYFFTPFIILLQNKTCGDRAWALYFYIF